ncbi:MAG: hypothetical protein CMO55_04660 [Verrucomicrobiales bacterium]|nr:hypothetical protein [Verrucomicrobiales bacterium]
MKASIQIAFLCVLFATLGSCEQHSGGANQLKRIPELSLSSRSISASDLQCTLLDSSGNLWFGAYKAGLCRYDPESGEWETFTESDGLSHNDIRCAVEDRKGNLWFGTHGKGISCYEPESGRWKTFTESDGLASNIVLCALEDREGVLWFGTNGQGVSQYVPEKGKWKTFTESDGLASNIVQCVEDDDEGNLWFGTNGRGISRYDKEDGGWKNYSKLNGLEDNDVQCTLKDSEGNLWFGTFRGGVSCYNPERDEWKTYKDSDGIANNDVRCILEDEDGNLWFGTNAEGVSRFIPASGEWQTFKGLDCLASNSVLCGVVDGDGDLWFGTFGGGVSKYQPRNGEWHKYLVSSRLKGSLVLCGVNDREGNLWFGTMGGGLSRYQPRIGEWKTYSELDGLGDNDVQCSLETSDGNLWFGTLGGGVSRYDPRTGEWKKFLSFNKLGDKYVQCALEDRKGNLWFGLWRGGVSKYTQGSNEWDTLMVSDGLPDNGIQCVLEDRKGDLWFGSYAGGVGRFSPGSGEWKTYIVTGNLGDYGVQSALEDNEGNLWFGTVGGGLSRFSPGSGMWKVFTESDGLLDNAIQTALKDSEGNLWFGTSKGVSRYSPKLGEWSVFTVAEGLANNHVSCVVEGGEGNLWFGTAGGVSKIQPKEKASGGDSQHFPFSSENSYSIALNESRMALHRPNGIHIQGWSDKVMEKTLVPTGGSAVAAWAGWPKEPKLWVGSEQKGLSFVSDYKITKVDSIPSNHVVSLSVGRGGDAWVGTGAGAALVSQENLSVSKLIQWSKENPDNIPSGPVDAIAATPDGGAFLGYNSISPVLFHSEEQAKLRSETKILQYTGDGRIKRISTEAGVGFAETKINNIVWTSGRLWVATPRGLFVVEDGQETVRLETAEGLLAGRSIEKVEADGEGRLYLLTAGTKESPDPTVIGWDPSSGESFIWDRTKNLPEVVHDLSIHPDGRLFLNRGRYLYATAAAPVFGGQSPHSLFFYLAVLLVAFVATFVFWWNLETQKLNRDPSLAYQWKPVQSVFVIAMMRERTAKSVWVRNGLSENRNDWLRPLVGNSVLPRLAGLAFRTLGRLSKVKEGEVGQILLRDVEMEARLAALASLLSTEIEHAVEDREMGLSGVACRKGLPTPLQRGSLVLIASNPIEGIEPEERKRKVRAILTELGRDPTTPYLYLDSGEGDSAKRWLAPDFLELRRSEVSTLLLAPLPQNTLLGLLHGQGLLQWSPYSVSGEVADSEMFYGRKELLRTLLHAERLGRIVVGPRRMGKTSLLRRLEERTKEERKNVIPVFVDMMGISNERRAIRSFQKAVNWTGDSGVTLGEAVEKWARSLPSGKHGLVLIDEADGLVSADRGNEYRILTALRSLQQDRVCSFVLAGFRNLYRETLNQKSPLFNFANCEVLGALDSNAAIELAREPMQRLGVEYHDSDLVPELTTPLGNNPSLIQGACIRMLEILRQAPANSDPSEFLTIQKSTIAEALRQMKDELDAVFRDNTTPLARIAACLMADRENFTNEELDRLLGDAISPRRLTQQMSDSITIQLTLSGFIRRADSRFEWSVLLLRETVLEREPQKVIERILKDISEGESHLTEE